jgi:CheY-like chemotaxis protein
VLVGHGVGRVPDKSFKVERTRYIGVPTAAEMAAMKTSSQRDGVTPGSPTGSSAHQPNAAGSLQLKDARILLVEDSWQLGNAMKRLLRVLGADVAGPAATIADAERLLAECTPDVAIVDINLRDGERAHDLIDRMQQQRIPVVVVTGYTTVSLRPGMAEAILQKPVSMETFLAILRPILARRMDR